jgi:hypothetical protein
MLATIFILHKHQDSFWKQSYKSIGILTQVFVTLTYFLDFVIYLLADTVPELDPKTESDSFFLNALRSNLEYFKEEQKFFDRIFWLYVILAFCFL